jgi:hypothetical protein
VGHLARDAHLTQESLKSFSVALHIWRKELERHWLADLEIVGAVDFSHPAPPCERDDPISIPQHGARQEATVPV